jgi:hypothetical protein
MVAVHHKECPKRSNFPEAGQKDISSIHLFMRLETFCVTAADEHENRQFWLRERYAYSGHRHI